MEVITCSTKVSQAAEFHKSIRLVQRYFQVSLCSFGFFHVEKKKPSLWRSILQMLCIQLLLAVDIQTKLDACCARKRTAMNREVPW